VGCFVAGLLFTATVGHAQPAAASEDRLARLRQAAGRGDLSLAERALADALAEMPGVPERVQAQLVWAATLTRATDRKSAEVNRSIDAAYQTAIKEAAGSPVTSDLEVRAHNNYSAFLLETGRPKEALRELEAIQDAMKSDRYRQVRPRFLFNYGEALQAAGDARRAQAVYQEAITLAPDLTPAAEAASRLALAANSESIGIPATIDLVRQLLRNQDYRAAETHLRAAFDTRHWLGHPQFPRVVAALASLLAAAPPSAAAARERLALREKALDEQLQSDIIDRRQHDRLLAAARSTFETDSEQLAFDLGWRPMLEAQRGFVNPTAARRITDLIDAFAAPEFPLILNPGAARSAYDHWWAGGEGDQRAFAALLRHRGDTLRRTGQPSRAVSRYALSWALDIENVEPALQLADLLLSDTDKTADPTGSVLGTFINELFRGKGEAYLGEDLENILRFHTILGTIFERQGRWGPPHNPMSAAFQWEHALQIQQRLLRRATPTRLQSVPGLHAKLAHAYGALGNPQRAWQEFVEAGEGYVAAGRPADARSMIDETHRLGDVATAADKQRLRRLEAQAALGPVV
jgi:Tfp pilus assembly protein PilF